ncbi:MAG: ATP-dependent zinc protease [Spirochaeta sp.]
MKKPPLVIGWREIVSLPDLGFEMFEAKIDTGARTTALHALDIEPFQKDGREWVRFRPPVLKQGAPEFCEAHLADRRAVKNTSGIPEKRYIIRTHLHLADRNYLIEISLADRGDMKYPMIIGRTAISGHRLLVDCSHSWLTRPNETAERGV